MNITGWVYSIAVRYGIAHRFLVLASVLWFPVMATAGDATDGVERRLAARAGDPKGFRRDVKAIATERGLPGWMLKRLLTLVDGAAPADRPRLPAALAQSMANYSFFARDGVDRVGARRTLDELGRKLRAATNLLYIPAGLPPPSPVATPNDPGPGRAKLKEIAESLQVDPVATQLPEGVRREVTAHAEALAAQTDREEATGFARAGEHYRIASAALTDCASLLDAWRDDTRAARRRGGFLGLFGRSAP